MIAVTVLYAIQSIIYLVGADWARAALFGGLALANCGTLAIL